MTVKEKVYKIVSHTEHIKVIESEIDALKQSILDEVSPYKVGDKIPTRDFAYREKIGEVTKILLMYSKMGFKDEMDFDIYVQAVILKKDGSHSQNIVSWKSWVDDNLKVAITRLKTGQFVQ